MRSRRPKRTALVVCALVPALAFGAGCGGDDNSGGLSGRDKLDVLQARGDILEYCSVQKGGSTDLTDRSLGIFLDATRDLVRVYRAHPNTKVEIPAEKKSLTMRQVMEEQIRALRKCGQHGREQAGLLEAAVQQSQARS